jgi:AcrR family transcriptional regulator
MAATLAAMSPSRPRRDAGRTAPNEASPRPVSPPPGPPAARTAAGRPRDPGADRRIVEATFRQLIELGYAGMSIESVAAEAGVARTTVYRRYPTKADLAIAALSVEVPFEVRPTAGVDPRARIEGLIRQVIATLIESGAIRILGSLLVEERREPELLARFRAGIVGPRRALVEEILRGGIERGEIRADIDPLVVTEMIAGAIVGHHAVLGLSSDDAWIRSLAEHVWAAIRAPGG